MIKITFIALIVVVFYFPLISQPDSLNYKTIKYSSVHKTYLSTELTSLFYKGINLNYSIMFKKKCKSASYFRLFLGINKDDENISLFPKLSGKYKFSNVFFYIESISKRNFVCEFGLGPALIWGDPIGRTKSYISFGDFHYIIQLQGLIACRYNFKKNPFSISASLFPTYDPLSNLNFFVFPSFSIGFGISRINYDEKKIRVYY